MQGTMGGVQEMLRKDLDKSGLIISENKDHI